MSKHLAPKGASPFSAILGRNLPGFHPTSIRSSWAATYFELRQAGFETRLDSKFRVLSNAPLLSRRPEALSSNRPRKILRMAVLAIAMAIASLVSWNLVSLAPSLGSSRAPAPSPIVQESSRACALNASSVLRFVTSDTVWLKLGGVRFSTVRVSCAKGRPRVRVIERVSDSSVQSFRVVK